MPKPISHREKAEEPAPKFASNSETSRAINENMLTTVTERSKGPNGKYSKAAAAAAVKDKKCRIEIPNPISLREKSDELNTAVPEIGINPETSEARVETIVEGLPNKQVSKAAVKATKCKIEIPNPISQARWLKVPLQNPKFGLDAETSGAITENTLKTVTERSKGPNGKYSKAEAAAAVKDKKCRIEIPNSISQAHKLKVPLPRSELYPETSGAITEADPTNPVKFSPNKQVSKAAVEAIDHTSEYWKFGFHPHTSEAITETTLASVTESSEGLPNNKSSKAAVIDKICKIELPNPRERVDELKTAIQNLNFGYDAETLEAITESMLTSLTESSEGLLNNKSSKAAVIDKICKIELPNPRERVDELKTAIQNLNFGYDAETLEAITESMLAGASDFWQSLSSEKNLEKTVKATNSKTDMPILASLIENVGDYNAALHNQISELTPETLGPITQTILAELPKNSLNESSQKDKKSKSIAPTTLASVTNLLQDSPTTEKASTSKNELTNSSESPVEEVDQFPYDALERIYLEMTGIPEEELSVLQSKKRKIAEQRRKMRKMAADDGGRMTLKQWKKENKTLDELVKDLYSYLDNVLARYQMECLEALDAQSRISKPVSASSFDSDDLVPKEKLALQLLVTRLPDDHLGKFLENHFKMEEFENFKSKFTARDKMNRENTLELPQNSAPNGEKDHRMVSKRALMDDIALRIKQWKRPFETILLPIAAWPEGYPRMYFNPKEQELIDSIVLGLSPLYEKIQENGLTLFSFSELEDLSYKVNYRISVMIDSQVQLNLFSTEAYEEHAPVSRRNRFGCEDWEILNRDNLVEYFIERITNPKIPEMSMFLLQPEILDLLTAEEKFAIVHYRLTAHGGSKTLQFATMPWIRNVHSKLDSLENRLKREMNEKNDKSSLWFPKSSRELSRRDDEDRQLLDCLLFMIIRKTYDRSDPLQRAEFNDDFRFVFSNRKLMFDYRLTMQCSYPRRMNPVRMDIFTDRFCTPKEPFVEKTRGLPYDECVLQTVVANRMRRKQHELAVKDEEYDPVKRDERMREESEQLRFLEERDEDKVMKHFLRPSPPPADDFFKRDDFAQLIVYTNDMKLPKRLTEQDGPRVRRKVKKDDPIRVARQQWKKL